jgi:hypothetical protein
VHTHGQALIDNKGEERIRNALGARGQHDIGSTRGESCRMKSSENYPNLFSFFFLFFFFFSSSTRIRCCWPTWPYSVEWGRPAPFLCVGEKKGGGKRGRFITSSLLAFENLRGKRILMAYMSAYVCMYRPSVSAVWTFCCVGWVVLRAGLDERRTTHIERKSTPSPWNKVWMKIHDPYIYSPPKGKCIRVEPFFFLA